VQNAKWSCLACTLTPAETELAWQAYADPRLTDPVAKEPFARVALAFVGADAQAKQFYQQAINDRSLLKARCAIIFNTSNIETTREKRVFGDPIEALSSACGFRLCGVATIHRRMFSIVVTSSEADRKAWLAGVAATINRFFPKGSHSKAAPANCRSAEQSDG
jgi:hypothetical protein